MPHGGVLREKGTRLEGRNRAAGGTVQAGMKSFAERATPIRSTERRILNPEC